MTSTIQRHSRPSLAPPSGPLPSLPVPKTRSPLPGIPDAPEDRPKSSGSGLPTPSPRRSVTVSSLPTPKPNKSQSTPSVPTLNTTNTTPAHSKPPPSPTPPTSLPTLRKISSIGAFPLPPKGAPSSRVSSLPPSPLSTSESTSDLNAPQTPKERPDPPRHKSTEGGAKKAKTPRSSGYGTRARGPAGTAPKVSSTPSLLNGSGENSFISSAEGAQGSDGFLSLPSPPRSRSSSADESCQTDGTTFEDVEGEPTERGRQKSTDSAVESNRTPGPGKDANKGNVVVSVRVRPDAGGSEASTTDGEWVVDGRRSLVSYRGKEGGDHRYDNVFSPHDNNSRVYDNAAKRLVRRVMEGWNGTVFAYGMTGTGKTFSMQGTQPSPGVIPLAITDIFSYIRENPDREFLLRVSYLEIYNEKIFDLLSQSSPGQQSQEEIKLREDSKRGVYATPLKEEIVQSPTQLLRVIHRGDQARRTGSTQFNSRSSRSHAVVQIVVESRERTPSHGAVVMKDGRRQTRIVPGGVLVSTLSLIDLAGSEKAAENKERRTEGAHINKSLLTLGTVIGKLSGDDEKEKGDGAKFSDKDKGLKHLPYRDSKLTRLLQPALSGDSLVSILCTIQLSSASTSAASTSSHTGETLNTLKFASRAKNNIVSHAKRNESNPSGGDAGSRALLDRYRIEIQELRSQLDAQFKAKEEAEARDEMEQDRLKEEELERQERTRHEEQMLEMQLARTALKERISHLNRLILSSKSLGVNSGRFSSASVPLNRVSTVSNQEFGRPVSLRSRDSMASPRDSAATLEVPGAHDDSIKRTFSSGSITTGSFPTASTSRMIAEESTVLMEDEEEGDDSGSPEGEGEGEGDGEGEASLLQQNRMLQADLSDKNRYIATLEKRLIQARRTSHSRVSSTFAHRNSGGSGGSPPATAGATDPESALQERDREIEALRARLDDQTRMVQALRSAARKRDAGLDDTNGVRTSCVSEPAGFSLSTTPLDPPHSDYRSRLSERASSRHAASATAAARRPPSISHRSNPSMTSRSSSSHGQGHSNFSKPLSPVSILTPAGAHHQQPPNPPPHHNYAHQQHPTDTLVAFGADPPPARPSSTSLPTTSTFPLTSTMSAPGPPPDKPLPKQPRRRSVDEMTALLDQMIADKVESGHVIRGDRGSLRVKRDTVMGAQGQGQSGEEARE